MTQITKKQLWAGRVLSALAALFLIVDGGMKLVKPPPVVETTVQLGYPESTIVGLGTVLLACTAIYLIPRTSILGAILVTGFLGGAVATHVRVGDGFSNLVSGFSRRTGLGRPLVARSPVASLASLAKSR